MLDKIDRRYFSGSDVHSLVQSVQATLHQQGISLQQTAPNAWSGRGQQVSYGFVLRVGLTLTPVGDATLADLRVSPDLEGSGIVIFVVAWLFFFPVAIILAVLGYQEWQRRSNELVAWVWAPLAQRMIAPPAPQWGQQQMGAPPGLPPGAGYGGPR
jgi:hypothetical protein